KLLIMRELQRYEMPTGWSDIIDTDTAGVFQGSAGNWTMRTPQVLVTVPQLAWAYLQRVNRAVDASGQPLTQAQIEQYDAAECLYQIVKLACEDENVDLASSVKEVGDADGDGLPEFQDAFTGMDRNYVTNAPANNPIMWNRWPAGFTNLNLADASGNFKESFHVSDYQEDPANLIEEQTGGSGQNLQVVSGAQAMLTFSADNHDYFDPLKLDMPVSSGGANYP